MMIMSALTLSPRPQSRRMCRTSACDSHLLSLTLDGESTRARASARSLHALPRERHVALALRRLVCSPRALLQGSLQPGHC